MTLPSVPFQPPVFAPAPAFGHRAKAQAAQAKAAESAEACSIETVEIAKDVRDGRDRPKAEPRGGRGNVRVARQ